MAKRFQVFVSSTFADLEAERRRIWETLISFDYIVAGMETFPATNNEQFEFIKKQILGSDYYVLVIGARYGSLNDEGTSFTEMEYHFAAKHGVPVLVFPIKDPDSVPVSKTDKDQDKQLKLSDFRQAATYKRIAHLWTNVDDLCLAIIKSLKNAENENPRVGWVRGDTPTDQEIFRELQKLQSENQKLHRPVDEGKRANATLPLKMESTVEIEYAYRTGKSVKKAKTALTIESIVAEFRLTERLDEEVVEQCIRGAIAFAIDGKYEAVSIEVSEVEKVLLMLAAQEIVRLRTSFSEMTITHGANWLIANAEAKLGRA